MKLNNLGISIPSIAASSSPIISAQEDVPQTSSSQTPPLVSTTETFTVAAKQTIIFTTGDRSLNKGFNGEIGFTTNTPSARSSSRFSAQYSSSPLNVGGSRTSSHSLGRGHSAADWYYNPSADNRDSVLVFNFANVNIKQGATISNAKLSFKKGSSYGSLASGQSDLFKIHAPLTDDAVWWNLPIDTGTQVDWTGLHSATNNTTVESPDISSVIQEIVNIPTWKSGNSFQIALFFAASTSQNQSASIQVKTGYNYDDSPNSDGAPQLELTHTGGSDYAGTIVEGLEKTSITSNLNNVGSNFGTNSTHNNTGSYSSNSIYNSGLSMSNAVERNLYFTGYYNSSVDANFKAFIVRFPNVPLDQGATVPTTKLSFVIPNHRGGEAGFDRQLTSNSLNPTTTTMWAKWNAHTYETGHHALNGDGTNDAVGIRIRAAKLTDIPANLSGLTRSDFNHPSGTTETGVSTVTDAFVDLSLEDYYTETSVYSSGQAANEYAQKYMKVTKDQPRFETPDLKNILQEIVNQSGWSSGNAIALLFYLPSFHTGSVSGSSYNRVDGLSFNMVAGNFKSSSNFDRRYVNLATNSFSGGSHLSAIPSDQRKPIGRMPKLLIG